VSNIEIFFSYSHKDEKLRDDLEKQLSLLKRQGIIASWHDRKIVAGQEWVDQIDTHLNTAQIILLLISPDFMASDYCYESEMMRAIERHKAEEALVIPVILRPTDWHSAPFANFQALPQNGKPVTTWSNRDEAFLDIARGIRIVVRELTKDGDEPSQLRKPTSDNRISERNTTMDHVLVVDDFLSVRLLLQTILRSTGYKVSAVSDGRQALAFIQEHRPDLIILDLGMPDIDGLKFLKRIRKMGINIPVIILTGSDNSYVVKGLKLGANGYVKKPFKDQDILPIVEELLGKKEFI